MEEHIRCEHSLSTIQSLPDGQSIEQLAEFYKLFSDFTRVKILCLLEGQPLCVCDIARALEMNQPAISHQLRVLKQGKLIVSRREGKSVIYSLADEHVSTILEMGMEHINE